MGKKLSIKEWKESHKKLAKRFWPAVERGARTGALRAIAYVRKASDYAAPASENGSPGVHDTGYYKRAWKYEVGASRITIYNAAPYAGVIEDGRRAGSKAPPSDVLVTWVRRKLKVPKAEARSVAFVVARAIGKRGLKGRHVLADATDAMADLIQKEIERAIDKELEKED